MNRVWIKDNNSKPSDEKPCTRGGWQRPLILPLFGFPWSPQLRNLSIIREPCVASMRETGWEQYQHQEVCLRCDSRVWSEFALGLLVIAFFAATDFFRSNVGLTFSFLLVLRLWLHAVYYAKNETSKQSLYMYMFLDAGPFGSLPAFKLCFCLEDPQG